MWGWLSFIDAEEAKPKSLKQMEADDSPVTLDDKIIEDHFFRDVFAVTSCWYQWRCLRYLLVLTGRSCSENASASTQQFHDFNVFTLSNSDFFFALNGQRRQCQAGCPIIWFKNQTRLLSPVIISVTDFETDHQSYTTNCQKKSCVSILSLPQGLATVRYS